MSSTGGRSDFPYGRGSLGCVEGAAAGTAFIAPSLHVQVGWQVPQELSELIVKRSALRRELFFQDPIRGTHPGVMCLPLPLDKLSFQHLQHLSQVWVSSQVPCLLRVLADIVEFPAFPVVVMVEILVPACGLACHGAVQEVLEGRRNIEILVDGKRHLEAEVVNEAEVLVVHGAHGVGHGDLMVALAAEDSGPKGLCLQHRQEGSACELDCL